MKQEYGRQCDGTIGSDAECIDSMYDVKVRCKLQESPVIRNLGIIDDGK